MKPSVGHKASVVLAVGFALWLGWQWLDVPETDKRVARKQPRIEETKTPPSPNPAESPQSLTLPAPPPPAPKVVAKPQPLKRQAESKIEQPTPASAEKKVEPVKPVVKKVEPKAPAPVVEKVKPAPKPTPKENTIEVTHAQTATGRALLRVLEHGKGPQVEIAWPKTARARDRLFDRLHRCFGMENAVMDGQGNLYRTQEPRGVRWEINLDRYSGFLRQAAGRLPSAEQRIHQNITAHHGAGQATLVRIFPRRVDASLLGGLRAVLGNNYQASSSIQARYDLQEGAVVVRDIRLNGQRVDGVIALAAYRRCGRRA